MSQRKPITYVGYYPGNECVSVWRGDNQRMCFDVSLSSRQRLAEFARKVMGSPSVWFSPSVDGWSLSARGEGKRWLETGL